MCTESAGDGKQQRQLTGLPWEGRERRQMERERIEWEGEGAKGQMP